MNDINPNDPNAVPVTSAPAPNNQAGYVAPDTPAPVFTDPVPVVPVAPAPAPAPVSAPVATAPAAAPVADVPPTSAASDRGPIVSYNTVTGEPIHENDVENREIIAYDPTTGKPIYKPTASEIDADNWVIESYDPRTGKPIYRKYMSVKGDHEYFVNNIGTVYGNSPGNVLAKIADVYNVLVKLADIHLVGLNTHEDSSDTEGN